MSHSKLWIPYTSLLKIGINKVLLEYIVTIHMEYYKNCKIITVGQWLFY